MELATLTLGFRARSDRVMVADARTTSPCSLSIFLTSVKVFLSEISHLTIGDD